VDDKEQNEFLPDDEGEIQATVQSHKMVTVRDEELKDLRIEATDYKDKYLRLLADVDNSRKRMQKEKSDNARYAVEGLLVDFLDPLDNLENALKYAEQMSDEIKHWAVGFQMILSQFKDVLANSGVQPLESKGTHFDPHSHEAVEMIETDEYEPGIIVEECIRGYKMGDRTIRPARVKVAKKVTKNNGEEQ
jgi:molecular chaperone GrpE